MSVASDGTQADNGSIRPVISGTGRFVAFLSGASNLVAKDTNNEIDLFVRDRKLGTTTRVSKASDGTQGDKGSSLHAISADGRHVAFISASTNLVSADTNDADDVFVHDRLTATTTRVSRASDGTQANDHSRAPDISADGRYVVFSSYASNLVPGDTNAEFSRYQGTDVFLHDRQSGTTSRVSVTSTGAQTLGDSHQAAISDDGLKVAFVSNADNLPGDLDFSTDDAYVHDRTNGTTTLVHRASDGTAGDGAADQIDISADGNYAVFTSTATNLVSGDTNSSNDVFLHHIQGGTTARVSVNSDGTQSNAFSTEPAISADGGRIAFASYADTGLVPGDTNATGDVYVYDRQAGSITRASVSGIGAEPNSDSYQPAIDADGTKVTFASSASNLVAGDFNDGADIFVRDLVGVQEPPPVGPQVLVGDAAVYEGDSGTRGAVFTVSLTEPAADTVTVVYSTANRSALKSSDYKAKSGTLSFPPGLTAMNVKVPVVGDTTGDGHEDFVLNLSSATGANIFDGTGRGTILDDDPATITGRRLFIGDSIVYEGDAGPRSAIFTVSLSQPHTSTVTVDYATSSSSAVAPGDYQAKTGTLSFAPGVTSQTIKVPVAPDNTPEDHERFNVTLSNANAPIIDGLGDGTIKNDD